MAIGPFLAGFECSTHRRRDGTRLDVIAATAHDRLAERDYRLLRRHGLHAARDGARWHLIEPSPGTYDWRSLDPMLDAAARADITVIWDLMHYGWPDWTSPWDKDFAARFAAFAAAAAARIGPAGHYVPVNEISFLGWAGGQVGYLNPFAVDRGDELKDALCAAAIAASRAIRSVDPQAMLMAAEPLIHVHPDPGTLEPGDGFNAAQFDALDTLLGRRRPELGGNETIVNLVGLNYYPQNQFTPGRATVPRGDPRYRPLRDLLVEAAQRYRKPLLLAETGCEDDDRPGWLAYVTQEVRAANTRCAGVGGICLYPILDHPGWDDDRHCRNGLFCGFGDDRQCFMPLLDELRRQQRDERTDNIRGVVRPRTGHRSDGVRSDPELVSC